MFKRILFLIVISFAANSFATKDQAANFINDLANRSISLIKDSSISNNDKETQLTNIFLESIDTKWIGKFAMGRYWRTLSPQQQSNYLELYSEYLASIYVPNFRNYTGNSVKVLGSSEVGPNEYVVQTQLINPSSTSDIKIDYRLSQKEGFEKFVIFDIIAEGVSLITTQRAEINSVMSQGGFDDLMNKFHEKNLNSAK